MIEFIGGLAIGIGISTIFVSLTNRASKKVSAQQEKIDRIAKAIITMYGKQSLAAVNNSCYWLTGYLREDMMAQRIIIRIPELYREMEQEEAIRKELGV